MWMYHVMWKRSCVLTNNDTIETNEIIGQLGLEMCRIWDKENVDCIWGWGLEEMRVPIYITDRAYKLGISEAKPHRSE